MARPGAPIWSRKILPTDCVCGLGAARQQSYDVIHYRSELPHQRRHHQRLAGPDGSKQFNINTTNRYFSSRFDAQGNETKFTYTTNSGIIKLTNVEDVDSRNNTFLYTNVASLSLISQVTDPHNHTTQLFYDRSGRLTNIIDSIGLTNLLRYDGTTNITHLITPYGTNTFTYLSGTDWKAIYVNQHGLRDSFYLGAEGVLDQRQLYLVSSGPSATR
jgi:YD repeat-containing protein